MMEKLVLLLVDIRVPRTITVCHGLSICLDLSQVPLHLDLLSFQAISLEVNHGSAHLLEQRMETYSSPLSSQKTPKSLYEHGRIPHGPSRSIPWLVNDTTIDNTATQ